MIKPKGRYSMIDEIKKHIRGHLYMSGIQRSSDRVEKTNEVFSPTWLVNEILDKFDQTIFTNVNKTFLDPCCGDGQALGEALIRKVENGSTFEQALSTIYGVDLMPDNVRLCQDRLLCGREDLRHIVEQNIVCADGLRYHYRFDGSHPYDEPKPLIKIKKVKNSNPYINDLFSHPHLDDLYT